jgi:hypothetical protein
MPAEAALEEELRWCVCGGDSGSTPSPAKLELPRLVRLAERRIMSDGSTNGDARATESAQA